MAERFTKKDKSTLATSDGSNERLIVYQLFPRIFSNECDCPVPWGSLAQNGSGKLNDLTPKVLESIKDLGINTLWLTGVIEHATKTDFTEFGIENDNPAVVKGEAGSPYAIKDYYDVSPAIAENVENRIDEFRHCISRVHEAEMKLIIDFVPNHTARRYHSDKAPSGIEDFGRFDDTSKFFERNNNYYYIPNQRFSPSFKLDSKEGIYFEFPAKATGNDCFSAFCCETDWYETVKLNYGIDYGDRTEHFDPIPDTWLKMLAVLRYWAAMGVDGFRCDMVFMVPLSFWHWVIPQVKKDYPGLIFIGEIYDVSQYRSFLDFGAFDFLYDKVNLYDTLVGIERHNFSAARLTDCWKTIDGIGNKMLNFLENHDEVRFASDEFAVDPSRVIPYLVVSSMISKGPFMIYYGQELGERGEENEGFAGHNHRTTIFDYWSVPSLRRWYNGGCCNDQLLTAHEKWLRNVYKRVLNLCNDSKALREGEFFDLMYANINSPSFDPHSLFCWLRYCAEEVILIIANFSREEKYAEIIIPDLAFEMTGLTEGEKIAKDLLWDNEISLSIKKGQPVGVRIPRSNALILKLENK